jgi:formate C-acetyltransferase
MIQYLDTDYEGAEEIRLLMRNIPRFGKGGSRADELAAEVSNLYTRLVKACPMPAGTTMIPGHFSFLNTITMGREVGATPNGRHAGAPISHGANPDPGLTSAVSATQLAVAVAAIQPGYGNAAPVQMELNPVFGAGDESVGKMNAFIHTIFAIGNTHLNITILDKKRLLEAHADPSKHPDLIVRVTGFCAYFANLSPQLRQMVIDRVIDE